MEEEESKLVNAEQETLMSHFGKPLNFTAHTFVLLVLGHLFFSQVSSRVTLESVWKLQIKQTDVCKNCAVMRILLYTICGVRNITFWPYCPH